MLKIQLIEFLFNSWRINSEILIRDLNIITIEQRSNKLPHLLIQYLILVYPSKELENANLWLFLLIYGVLELYRGIFLVD